MTDEKIGMLVHLQNMVGALLNDPENADALKGFTEAVATAMGKWAPPSTHLAMLSQIEQQRREDDLETVNDVTKAAMASQRKEVAP